MCPNCLRRGQSIKCGTYHNKRRSRIQRFYCKHCKIGFSAQTKALTYREKKPRANLPLLRLVASGVSQRRSAELLGINRITVARKIVRMGRQARFALRKEAEKNPAGPVVVLDEVETFEHTKLKPLAVAIAVEHGSRRILAVEVASMPPKGRLAAKSRKKYGPRADHRHIALEAACREIKRASPTVAEVRSDLCPRYPRVIRQQLPHVKHRRFKSKRARDAGLGELKRGGFDPLFSLNHSAAMFRDNVKTLARRTWCTTKRSDRLQYLLYLYAWTHNQRINGAKMRDIAVPPYAAM